MTIFHIAINIIVIISFIVTFLNKDSYCYCYYYHYTTVVIIISDATNIIITGSILTVFTVNIISLISLVLITIIVYIVIASNCYYDHYYYCIRYLLLQLLSYNISAISTRTFGIIIVIIVTFFYLEPISVLLSISAKLYINLK